jgi:GDP-D-mannose 3',5'-epimerase
VRGRCSENSLIKARLGWAPSIRLRDGLERTYHWIHEQMATPAISRRVYA